MLRYLNEPLRLRWRTQEYTVPVQLIRMLLVSVGLAILWWAFAFYLLLTDAPFHVWGDQRTLFLVTNKYFFNMYVPGRGYFNAPWSLLVMAPFNIIPYPIAVLIQLIILFVTITLIIYKFSWLEITFEENRNPLLSQQGRRDHPKYIWLTLLLVLTSPIALDNALELNLEWIALIGLIVPTRYSLIFLSVKPTVAFGYVFSFRFRELFQAGVMVLLILLGSFLIWGFWIPDYITATQRIPLQSYNVTVAMVPYIGWAASIAIGAGLAIYAFLKRDGLLGILAGYFFVPYIAGYSVFVHFALLMIRWRWVGIALYAAIWLLLAMILLG